MVVSVFAVGFSGSAAAQEPTLDEMEGDGTEADPYVITNVDELQAMNQDRDAHYVLGNDIDASETETWNAGKGFEPIGDRDTSFTGTFDGQNYTVSGLTIDRPGARDVGLFGFSKGTVTHVDMAAVSVVGDKNSGGLVGNSRGPIRDVTVSGTVEGRISAGGVVGSTNAEIVASGTRVTVQTDESAAGGLAGAAGGDVSQSYATGDVSGDSQVGGLVGELYSGELSGTFATGDVDGTGQTGGLVGDQSGTITRSYATGDVDAAWNVGGLVGRTDDEAGVTRSYTTGSVGHSDSEYGRYGNLIGNAHSGGALAALYWNTDAASLDRALGGDDAGAISDSATTGLSTSEMQGTAARENMDALNFGPAWAATAEYPVQRWSVETVSFSLDENRLARGDSTAVSVTLELVDGRTLSATETASYETNNSIASVSDGTVETSETGTVNVTATIAGETKTETLEVLEPPNISATAASVDEDLVANGVRVPIETTVINTGDIAGEDTVSLRTDGETVSEVTVSGEPGVEQNVTVGWQPDSLGTYDVAVDDAAAGTVEVVEPPELTTESASTNVSVVSAGASVPVSVTIANDDRLRGARNATLAVDGENVTSERVSVEADNETTTALSWTPEEPGTYDLAVDGVAAGTVRVVPADTVTVETVSTPANATAGEAVDVDVTVTNTADVTVSERLRLTANGQTVGATWAKLPVNDTTTVTLSGVVTTPGETTLSAESTSSSASADLAVLEPASFAITSVDAPSAMTAGQSATVTATIENQGGVVGSRTMTLSFGGAQLTSQTAELAAGATTTVSADISPSSAGERQVTARTDDDNGTATVTVDGASTPTTTGAAGTDTSGGSGPGFGVAVAVVALLAGVALRRRR